MQKSKRAIKEDRRIISIFSRYLFVLLIAIFAFSLFYTLFLPLTIYPVNYLLGLFYDSAVQGSSIFVAHTQIELISACIAGSAYYLLLLLNFSLPLNWKKRVLSLGFSFALFLAINILRISIFSLLYINEFKYFNFAHLLFWYVLSGVIVSAVWLSTIKMFKIKDIPFYTDLKLIYSKTKTNQKR